MDSGKNLTTRPGKKMADEKRNAVYGGRAGEEKVAKILEALPAERYQVLNDLLLRTPYGTVQIDHLVISAAGIFVIETKNYAGTVTGTDRDREWIQTRGDSAASDSPGRTFYNPVRQNFTHIQALRQLLKPLGGEIPLISIVAFPESCELRIRSRSRVVRYGDLPALISEKKADIVSPEKQAQAAALLTKRNITDPEARKRHAASVRKKEKGAK